jgi:hypothetical protein
MTVLTKRPLTNMTKYDRLKNMTVKKYDNEKVIKKEYRDKNIQSSKEEYYCDGVVLYVSGFWRVH